MKFLFRRKPKIFLSYRREDSSGHAGRLFADLARHFGADLIFMDIDAIEAGEDFVDAIDRSVRSCDVLIVIIGKQWLVVSDGTVRRLENPNDYVRLEITAALQRKIPVIPILVQQVDLPRAQDLPPDLAPLTRRQSLEISDSRWDYDVKRLIKRLEQVLPKQTIAWQKLGVIIGCITILSIAIWLTYKRLYQPNINANIQTEAPTPNGENINSTGGTNTTNLASKNLNDSTSINTPKEDVRTPTTTPTSIPTPNASTSINTPREGIKLPRTTPTPIPTPTVSQLVTVPNVMGLKMHVALQRLRQIGLSARVEKRVGDNCIVGVVFDQNPQPGTFIRGGSSVGIVVCDRDR